MKGSFYPEKYLSRMIDQKMGENDKYKVAAEHMDNLINGYVFEGLNQDKFSAAYHIADRLRVIDGRVADLRRIKNIIKKNTSPQQ